MASPALMPQITPTNVSTSMSTVSDTFGCPTFLCEGKVGLVASVAYAFAGAPAKTDGASRCRMDFQPIWGG